MVYIGNREDTVRTRTGHVIYFSGPGDEVFVPNDPLVERACEERGHRPKKEVAPVKEQIVKKTTITEKID